MFIEKLKIKNFKNIKEIFLIPEKGLNVIHGNNAQGKTNLIESIYVSSNFKSYRTIKNEDLIKFGENKCSIKADIDSLVNKNCIEYSVNHSVKTFKLNGKKISKPSEIVDNFLSIIYCPEDINIIRSGPEIRRNFIDRSIFLIDPYYIKHLNTYKKSIRQKTVLLKNNPKKEALEAWNDVIVKEGSYISYKRSLFVCSILPFFREIHAILSSKKENIDLVYKFKNLELQEIKKIILKDLESRFSKEISLKQCIVGPHRDEISFFIDNKSTKYFGSQGQQKTFVLGLKLSLVNYIEKMTGKLPVLLIDDISSELDKERKNKLLDFIFKRKCQTFLTTTDLDNIDKKYHEQFNKVEILNGMIVKQ